MKWSKEATFNQKQIKFWWRIGRERLIGLPCKQLKLVVVDTDRHPGGPDGVTPFDDLIAEHGGLPGGTPVIETQSGSRHYCFKVPSGLIIGNSSGRLPKGIDVRGVSGDGGGYIIAPGSEWTAPDGEVRAWREMPGSTRLLDAIRDGTLPELPEWILDLIIGDKKGDRTDAPHERLSERARQSSSTSNGDEREYLERALAYVPSDDREIWLKVGGALHDSGNAWARELWDSWSRTSSKFNAKDQDATWKSFGRPYAGSRATMGTIIEEARYHGFDGRKYETDDEADALGDIIAENLMRKAKSKEKVAAASDPQHGEFSSETIQRAMAKAAAEQRARFEEAKRIEAALSRGATLDEHPDGTIIDAETGEIIVDGSDARPGETPTDRLHRKSAEWRERIEGSNPGGADHAQTKHSKKAIELETVNAASLAGQPVPVMRWHVDDMIPASNVTMLSGDGATGKSLLALQLAVATATGGYWIGFMPAVGRVVYLSAEDELEELHRRLARMVPNLEKLGHLTIVPLAGKDAVLAAPSGKDGLLRPTEIYAALRRVVESHLADFVILDTLADLFGGDEIKKVHARQFIGMLRGMALELECTIVLLSHPSQSGMSSGEGTSGNVAWNNSVRSRLYFERRFTRDGYRTLEDDRDIRILSMKKNNRAPNGGQIVVRYDRGQFVRENTQDLNTADMAREAERVFLRLLEQFEREGRHVSPSKSPTYAPAVFANHPDNAGFGKVALEKAMNRLLSAERIKIEQYGPPSRQRQRLCTSKTSDACDAESHGGVDE